MTQEEKIKEMQDRLQKVRSWDRRLERLANRRKNPMSQADFCRKYGFHPAGLSRRKNGKEFPTPETVEQIERALKKEGV